MNKLLNFCCYDGKPLKFDGDWQRAQQFLQQWQFDGYEIYPFGDLDKIPDSAPVGGIHLRFFIIMAPLWRQDNQRLLEIFGSWENVDKYYGGRDAEIITEIYASQLALADRLGSPYVVFHPADCDLNHVYDWQFPWQTKDTLDMCAEVINAATARSNYQGKILFENLWWPGSFRLESAHEYDYLRSQVNHHNCGIVLDTGHMLNMNQSLRDEQQASRYLCDKIRSLGEVGKQIDAIHLSKSLSGEYVKQTQANPPAWESDDFWERMRQGGQHVANIDQHDAFDSDAIAPLLELIQPEQLIFEFTADNFDQWQDKVARQKRALHNQLWPHSTMEPLCL